MNLKISRLIGTENQPQTSEKEEDERNWEGKEKEEGREYVGRELLPLEPPALMAADDCSALGSTCSRPLVPSSLSGCCRSTASGRWRQASWLYSRLCQWVLRRDFQHV